MQSGRRGIRSASIAATLSLSLALSACGSTPSGAPSTTGTKAPIASTSIPATTTSTTLAPTSVAVLERLPSRMGRRFDRLWPTRTPSDPELAATMVDPSVQTVQGQPLRRHRRAGMVGREARARCGASEVTALIGPRRRLWSTAPTAGPRLLLSDDRQAGAAG